MEFFQMAQNQNNEFNNLQCIWMKSNFIQYKLCDKNFNCDDCLFDKVMQNARVNAGDLETDKRAIVNILDDKLEQLNSITCNDGYKYLKNNIVLKNLFGNTYYMGLSPLAKIMLDEASGFNYCKDGQPIQTHYPIVQFFANWGSVKVHSPLNFYCLGRLKQEIKSQHADDWFLLMEVMPEELEYAEISKEDFSINVKEVEKILLNAKNEFSNIGPTLNDGGQVETHLNKVLGKDLYYNILEHIFFSK